MATNLHFSVGVQLGLSTTVWGFKSGEDIDHCEYLQVRDSNKCPEGDLPTRDTHLRHLAPGLARTVSSPYEQRKRPKSHGRDSASSGGARHDALAYPVAVLRPSERPKTSVSSRSLGPGSVM